MNTDADVASRGAAADRPTRAVDGARREHCYRNNGDISHTSVDFTPADLPRAR